MQYSEEQKEQMRQDYEARRERERSDAIDLAAEFVPKVIAIASALGAGWSARFEEISYGNLQGITDSARFYLALNGVDRIYGHKRHGTPMYDYSGIYPRCEDNYSFNRNDDPSAGINFDKSPDRIASELKSRLLVTADKLYTERYKEVRKRDQRLDRYAALVQSLELALDQEAKKTVNYGSVNEIGGYAGRMHYRFVTDLSGDGVKIELSWCSQEMALELARMINAEKIRSKA